MVEPAKPPRIKASDFDKYLVVHDDWIHTLVQMRKTGQIKADELEEKLPEAFLKMVEYLTKVLKENKIINVLDHQIESIARDLDDYKQKYFDS